MAGRGKPEATDPNVAARTGGDPTTVEQEGLTPNDKGELPELSQKEYGAAIASSMGGTDNYPYVDRTAIPMHERNLSAVNNPLTEASQAELNPAFTAKAEDGGPVNAKGESIGTAPNVNDIALARAQNAEDAGNDQKDAVAAVKEQIAEGEKQQMDAQAVTDAAQDRAPAGIDASTGRKEGEATVPGSPSGMKPSSDGEAGTAGAKDA